jgi:hypothetical protein
MPRKTTTPGKTSQIKIAADFPKAGPGRPLTSERIASDLEAFRAGGGRIEVLGITKVLTPSEHALATRTAAAVGKTAPRAATKGD